jgi:hypothetical protein
MNKIERPFERRIDALRRTHQGMPAALNISVRQFPGSPGRRCPGCRGREPASLSVSLPVKAKHAAAGPPRLSDAPSALAACHRGSATQ